MTRRALVLAALALLSALPAPAAATHAGDPLRVTSDAELGPPHWSGSGTESDPYRLTPGAIRALGGYGVEIANTRKHVNLTGLAISGGGAHSDGLRLHNVRNVTVWAGTFEANRWSVHVRDSADVVVAGSTMKASAIGVFLESSQSVTVRDNRIALNEKNIVLRNATNNTLRANDIATATGQLGLAFEDNRSFDNAIATSNVVNFVPVRWYTHLDNATLTDITVGLAGITNVAQIMLYNVSDVRLERPVATSGTASGIVLHQASRVVLARPFAENNGGTGILAQQATDLTLEQATTRNNGASGVSVAQASNVTMLQPASRSNGGNGISVQQAADLALAQPVAEGNRGHGISIHQASRVELAQPRAEGNTQSGMVLDGVNASTLLQPNATRNGASGLSLRATNDTRIDTAVSQANAREALRADAARNLTLEHGALTGGALAFDGSRDVLVKNTSLDGSAAVGIALARSSGRFEDVAISQRATGVSFTAATGSNFTRTSITLASTGFAFDGPASYDNGIGPTNLVNGTPVRWYTNLAGPVALEGLAVETRGITNVAQIMVYRSSNVSLVSPVARNGSAAGIVFYLANDSSVTSANVSGNAAQGILVEQGERVRVAASRVRENGAEGVKLRGAGEPTAENNVVESNRARGILADGGSGALVRGNAVVGNLGTGIAIDRVASVAALVQNNVVERNGGGISATAAKVGEVRGNRILRNGADGLLLSGIAGGARIEENEIEDHARGIRLAHAGGTELTANVVRMNATQWGVQFDDEASYDVAIATSNTVNGVPLRWYVGAAAPTNVSAARVELPQITNVAQVMLYKVANVTLDDATAANGTARGIYVYRSDNVTVQRSRAEGNAGAGVVVAASNGTRIDGAAIARNRGGVAVASTSRVAVENSTLRDNGESGIALVSAPDAKLVGNALAGHAKGVVLDATRDATLLGNDVTVTGNQTAWHFAQPAAYANDIGPTNRVNGASMRWHVNLSNVTIEGIRADVRGMTNVAQVALFGADNVTLRDALAANGTGVGFLVEGGRNVSILSSNASDNAGLGARIASNDGALRNTTLARNAAGVALQSAPRAVLDNLTVLDNLGEGVAAVASAGLLVRGSLVIGGSEGIRVRESAGVRVMDNE
ncbi:MAG TPA: right-handed parallel beta-helix repeat-containing protein, partial [Candidatus Thermoplasmatota archaeon]|nr:right-handed parallel beta-helix repeat-containing protein [Candidatus Thermoplasmatota archaeon]